MHLDGPVAGLKARSMASNSVQLQHFAATESVAERPCIANSECAHCMLLEPQTLGSPHTCSTPELTSVVVESLRLPPPNAGWLYRLVARRARGLYA
jgi:hypothetical protein